MLIRAHNKKTVIPGMGTVYRMIRWLDGNPEVVLAYEVVVGPVDARWHTAWRLRSARHDLHRMIAWHARERVLLTHSVEIRTKD